MGSVWQAIIKGYLRIIEPGATLLVRSRVNLNFLTTFGTLCSIAGGVSFALGRIRLGGFIIGLCAIFAVLDGVVARRTGQATVLGAFYDSTLDRVTAGGAQSKIRVIGGTKTLSARFASRRAQS